MYPDQAFSSGLSCVESIPLRRVPDCVSPTNFIGELETEMNGWTSLHKERAWEKVQSAYKNGVSWWSKRNTKKRQSIWAKSDNTRLLVTKFGCKRGTYGSATKNGHNYEKKQGFSEEIVDCTSVNNVNRPVMGVQR